MTTLAQCSRVRKIRCGAASIRHLSSIVLLRPLGASQLADLHAPAFFRCGGQPRAHIHRRVSSEVGKCRAGIPLAQVPRRLSPEQKTWLGETLVNASSSVQANLRPAEKPVRGHLRMTVVLLVGEGSLLEKGPHQSSQIQQRSNCSHPQ